MVCLNESHNPDGLVTDFIRQSECIPTIRGNLPAKVWLEREQSRFAKSGILTEIVQAEGGRIALLKQG